MDPCSVMMKWGCGGDLQQKCECVKVCVILLCEYARAIADSYRLQY